MLSKQDVEILQHLANGLTQSAIGEKYSINEKAVRAILKTIRRTLGVESDEESVAIAVFQGKVTYKRTARFSESSALASLVAQGKSNKEIADILEISEGSVKQKLHRMFRKFNVHNRLELVALYIASH